MKKSNNKKKESWERPDLKVFSVNLTAGGPPDAHLTESAFYSPSGN
jgi:hypothetical protein